MARFKTESRAASAKKQARASVADRPTATAVAEDAASENEDVDPRFAEAVGMRGAGPRGGDAVGGRGVDAALTHGDPDSKEAGCKNGPCGSTDSSLSAFRNRCKRESSDQEPRTDPSQGNDTSAQRSTDRTRW